jgi:hypothetical protein
LIGGLADLPHPADRQEAGISVALDAPISQYHTMSPEFVADINQRAGTLAICNSTASRMRIPVSVIRLPVIRFDSVRGYQEHPWRVGCC